MKTGFGPIARILPVSKAREITPVTTPGAVARTATAAHRSLLPVILPVTIAAGAVYHLWRSRSKTRKAGWPPEGQKTTALVPFEFEIDVNVVTLSEMDGRE